MHTLLTFTVNTLLVAYTSKVSMRAGCAYFSLYTYVNITWHSVLCTLTTAVCWNCQECMVRIMSDLIIAV